VETVNTALSNYDMDDAARALYEFLWGEFCDWYVEFSKPRLRSSAKEKHVVQTVLYHVLETMLRLLHPIMPFITEEIWQALPHEGESIMVAPFPVADQSFIDESVEKTMARVMEAVRAQRDLKASAGLTLRKVVEVLYQADSPDLHDTQARILIERGAGTVVTYVDSPPADSEKYLVQTVADVGTFYLRAPEVDREKERARIMAELESVRRDLARSQAKLANEQFLSRAPSHVVEKERRIAAELQAKSAKLEEQLAALGL
jgi:valyl-tRNA synthetase